VGKILHISLNVVKEEVLQKQPDYPLLVWFTLLAAFCLSTGQAQEPARCASDFVDAMGICVHYGYTDTVYGNFDLVQNKLVELGIRHVRDGSYQRSIWERWKELYLRHGIRVTTVIEPTEHNTITDTLELLKDYSTCIDAIEGPNESDVYTFNYQNKGFPEGVRDFQNDLYHAVKSDRTLSNLPVIGPSMARPEHGTEVAPLAVLDYECMHSYAGGNLPSHQLDSRWLPYAHQILGVSSYIRPVVATECGYDTITPSTNSQYGISEAAQAKYIPRLFAEYFNRGIQRTFTYELFDEGSNDQTAIHKFGLLHSNGTMKPAFAAERNLISLLFDPNASFTPHAFFYKLSGDATKLKQVHHTLLEKSNGDFYLLMWQEVQSYDLKTHQDVSPKDTPIILQLDEPIAEASALRPSEGSQGHPLAINNGCIHLSVPDEVIIIKLTPVLREHHSLPLSSPLPSPVNLNASNIGTSIALSWQPPPNNDVRGYFVFRNDTYLGSTSQMSWVDGDTWENTGYTYSVKAYNKAGNLSPAVMVKIVSGSAPL